MIPFEAPSFGGEERTGSGAEVAELYSRGQAVDLFRVGRVGVRRRSGGRCGWERRQYGGGFDFDRSCSVVQGRSEERKREGYGGGETAEEDPSVVRMGRW